jgi:hypothetical protein
MSNTDRDYSVYRMNGLPAGLFGEAYVVCAGYDLPNEVFKGEWYILTQRPQEDLHHGSIEVSGEGLPSELGIIDVKFARAEALSQAKIELFQLIEQRTRQVNREDLAYLPFELQYIESPLLGCWMRGRFNSELTKIKELTGAPNLQTYLSLMQQVSFKRITG